MEGGWCTILAFLVTEVLGDGQTGESYTCTGPWRLVHLAKHQGDLGIAVQLDDRGFLHFVVKIIALTGTFAHTCEDRVTTMCLCDVVLGE